MSTFILIMFLIKDVPQMTCIFILGDFIYGYVIKKSDG